MGFNGVTQRLAAPIGRFIKRNREGPTVIAMDVPRTAASARRLSVVEALSDALVVEHITVRWTHVLSNVMREA